MMTFEQLWHRLRQVRSLSFVAQSGGESAWDGRGTGTVAVEQASSSTMTFTESGTWRPEGGKDIHFSNVYRWTLDAAALRLEHLRFGANNPVYLFDLAQTGEREWRSVSPHHCREDCYSAVLLVHDDRLVLRWAVDGPRKRQTIEYVYTGQEPAT
jgi:hypothetical protein